MSRVLGEPLIDLLLVSSDRLLYSRDLSSPKYNGLLSSVLSPSPLSSTMQQNLSIEGFVDFQVISLADDDVNQALFPRCTRFTLSLFAVSAGSIPSELFRH
jgi:hypothetical protein